MKKTFLTFVAVGFGVSVSFAQVTPVEETQNEAEVIEQTDAMYQDDARVLIEMVELPVAVQDAFKNGQYKDREVLAIYEVPAGAEEDPAVAGVVYEFELAPLNADAAAGEGEVTEAGMEGIEKENVSAVQPEPELIIVFDQNGQLIEEEQPEVE
ncbi:hypothetical protein [Nafulsella turpanensis]|uniref:hypothetical protein n=1 Tax=Nafulsella turpanensis TaxID=1265690 RepID=UPI00034BA1D6|nr:hypothetical protein [Nafulsella turpanensis]